MHRPEQIHHSRIIYSPLTWGLGHVSRSIAILDQLLKQDNQITVFCTPDIQRILELYFTQLCFEPHPGYDFSFDQAGFKSIRFIWHLPSLFRQQRRELNTIATYVKHHPVDYIISDQRFGFRNKDFHSIFITHQTKLALPWYLSVGQAINHLLIQKFDATWIVDDELNRYAGKLSQKTSKKQYYIGIKSRFQLERKIGADKKLNVLLFNGPVEFQRILFDTFNAELTEFDVIIGANPALLMDSRCITSWEEADEALNAAAVIYSFCGYSTLMDVISLGCTWECIPTPGQTEQIYLYKKALTKRLGL